MDAAATPAPAPRSPAMTPEEKRARHYRRVRIATWTTIVGVVGFALALVLLIPKEHKTLDQQKADDAQALMERIAWWARKYADKWGHLPQRLPDIKADPEESVDIDAQPWDRWEKPIEYRIVDESTRDFRLRSWGPDKKPDTADDVVWPAGKTWR